MDPLGDGLRSPFFLNFYDLFLSSFNRPLPKITTCLDYKWSGGSAAPSSSILLCVPHSQVSLFQHAFARSERPGRIYFPALLLSFFPAFEEQFSQAWPGLDCISFLHFA